MPVPQQKFREVIFQMLYSLEIGKGDPADIQNLLMKELSVTKKVVRDALEKVQLIQSKQDEIDEMIGKASLSYTFSRIQSVEKNILRLGTYELFFADEIPPKVAIAEAIRLARKFGTPESASFVNAVLDSLYQASIGAPVDQQQVSETIEALKKSEEAAKKAIIKNTEDGED